MKLNNVEKEIEKTKIGQRQAQGSSSIQDQWADTGGEWARKRHEKVDTFLHFRRLRRYCIVQNRKELDTIRYETVRLNYGWNTQVSFALTHTFLIITLTCSKTVFLFSCAYNLENHINKTLDMNLLIEAWPIHYFSRSTSPKSSKSKPGDEGRRYFGPLPFSIKNFSSAV